MSSTTRTAFAVTVAVLVAVLSGCDRGSGDVPDPEAAARLDSEIRNQGRERAADEETIHATDTDPESERVDATPAGDGDGQSDGPDTDAGGDAGGNEPAIPEAAGGENAIVETGTGGIIDSMPDDPLAPPTVEKPPKDGVVRPVDSKRVTTKYDHHFIKYSKRFFGVGFDWRWFKAQSMAESALDNTAESWCGAKGLMQLMDATAAEIRSDQPWIVDTMEPEWNVAGGIYYDSKVIKMWNPNSRDFRNRLCFMFGGYNAGNGNILHYQKRCMSEGSSCGSCNDWCGIVPYSNKETIGYVDRIFRFMAETY